MQKTPPLQDNHNAEEYAYQDKDEVNLVDVLLTLRKHKNVMIMTLVVSVVIGVFAAFLLPKQYEYLTSLEIGTTVLVNRIEPIESPETVKAKLENSFIPQLQFKLSREDKSISVYDILVSIPKKSSLIVLKSKGPERLEQQYTDFHTALINKVTQDHAKLLNVLRKNLDADLQRAIIKLDELEDASTLASQKKAIEMQLTEAETRLETLTNPDIFGIKLNKADTLIQRNVLHLESLKDDAKVIQSRIARISDTKKLIRTQILELEKQLENAVSLQQKSIAEVNDESRAMTQLMIDNDIRSNQALLAKLKERLHVKLENDLSVAEKLLADNKRDQSSQIDKISDAKSKKIELIEANKLDQQKLRANIAEIESRITKLISDHRRAIAEQNQSLSEIRSKLDNFVETKAVVPPTRSINAISTSTKTIILLSVILGLIFAILAAFLSELRDKIRLAVKERSIESRPTV